MLKKILKSKLDDSVNFIFDKRGETLESRFVQREKDYFCCYLSSQTGCRQACRMCHLTASKQTTTLEVRPEDIYVQADAVMKHYDESCSPAQKVHYNFMARGEFLVEDGLRSNSDEIFFELGKKATTRNLRPLFNVSTIMPEALRDERLSNIFRTIKPEIYYSLYSAHEDFRKTWLPNALPLEIALKKLKEWQDDVNKIIKIHWCFINNCNDSYEDVAKVWQAINRHRLHANVNIVRYNPYSEKYGRESPESKILFNQSFIQDNLNYGTVRIIDRVGIDVNASCGTFV